jgi:hypothetical protein
MGLVWNPGPKPCPGCEEEFFELWRELALDNCAIRVEKATRLFAITVNAFETLNTPCVGYDSRADEWF